MIYASDLDRTLIYSQHFISAHPNESELILVDSSTTDSYISKDVAIRLVGLTKNNKVRFIPVTTRSVDEYSRVKIPGVTAGYAITSNGGVILHNGGKLKAWEERRGKERDMYGLMQMAETINTLTGISRKSKIIDGTYIFNKTFDADATIKEIDKLKEEYKEYKFVVERNKIYAIPIEVSKGIALKWLQNYLEESTVLASGDSVLDISMLEVANLKVVPAHGSILEKYSTSEFIIVESGVCGPLQTLRIVEKRAMIEN